MIPEDETYLIMSSNIVAANKLCRHVGLGCATYQGSTKSSPGL